MRRLPWVLAVCAIAGAPWVPHPARAQANAARALITTPIDERALVRLPGNVRPEANARNDRGRVADSLPLQHLQLLLKRPLEREQALQRYLDSVHDRTAANFHRWLSPAQLAQQYGPAPQDIAAVSGWLTQQGFVINGVYAATLIIDFSGTAGQIAAAFHCEIHDLDVDGVRHRANMTDPQIPGALAPAVAGIVSLHDFRPQALHSPRASRPAYTTGNSATPYAVTPPDLATIYNLNAVFAAGNTGQGQTIVVIEDSDVHSTDWTTFRAAFGLSGYTAGSLAQVHPAPPSGPNNCGDPGVAGDEFEAILDAEWASAAAPSAAIELASCRSTSTIFGGLVALQNLLNESTSPPAIISISYGACEVLNGATANAAYIAAYQQAVAEGVSVYVSSGDQGAASCDASETPPPVATHGVAVSGLASTPYNVAVGGTDFDDTDERTSGNYWSVTNSSTFGSALSYIPEIPWNDSCASAVIAGFAGFSQTYGSAGFCNSSTGANFRTITAASGGPSGCASGSATTAGVVSGTCQGTPKPSWQSGVPGIPSDGVRDLPDVSLFASNGVWGHYYVVCKSDAAACTGAPSTWSGAGGTSFAAPILAGFQALVNTHMGSRQGNPNYVYYALATSQFASGLNCNSSGAAAAGCVFYDIVKGDVDVPCTGSQGCYTPSGTYGVLNGAASPSFVPAYAAATGWDFATGIGTVNAYNLVAFWGSSDLDLTVNGIVNGSGELSYSLTVANPGPQTATAVTVTSVLPAGMSLVTSGSTAGCTQSGQTLSCALNSLTSGTNAMLTILVQPNSVTGQVALTFSVADGNGDLNLTNDSAMVTLTIAAEGAAPMPEWALFILAASLITVVLRLPPRGQGPAKRSCP